MTRISRLSAMMCAATVALVLVTAMSATAGADETIVSGGPIQSLWVGDDLACQVSYLAGDTFEFYPSDSTPGDCSTFVGVDDTLYAPDFDAHAGTATSHLGAH